MKYRVAQLKIITQLHFASYNHLFKMYIVGLIFFVRNVGSPRDNYL